MNTHDSDQPTHSAQEAAERAAEQIITERYPMRDQDAFDIYKRDITAIILRHFPSTPTQSQQPPLSPGSGKALRAELTRFQEYAFGMESALRGARASGTASELSLVRAECAELRFQNSQLRELLAQPATPPLTSIGDGKDGQAAYPDSFGGVPVQSENRPDTSEWSKTLADVGDAALAEARYYREMLEWLHTGCEKDPEGYEWGIYRVKMNEHGQPVSVLHTFTDLSDLRAEMVREKDAKVLAAMSAQSPQAGREEK